MFKKLVLTVPIIALISSLSSASGKPPKGSMEESNRGSSALTSGETDRSLAPSGGGAAAPSSRAMHVRFDHALDALDRKDYEGARQGFKALVENGSFQAVPYLLAFSGKLKGNPLFGHSLPQKALDDQRLGMLLDLALLGDVQRGCSLDQAYKSLCKGVPRNAKAAKKKKEQEKLDKLSGLLFTRDSRLELLEQVYDPRIRPLIENKFPLDTYNVEDFSKTVVSTTAKVEMSKKYAALKVVTNYGDFNSKGGKGDALLCEVLDSVVSFPNIAERIFYAGYRAVYLEDYRHIFKPRGFQKHEKKVYELLLSLKNAQLQHSYGELLHREKDFSNAYKYYQLAADQGQQYAQYYCGYELHSGEHQDKEPILARYYFQKAADKGYRAAQYHYGTMLYEGEMGEIKIVPWLVTILNWLQIRDTEEHRLIME